MTSAATAAAVVALLAAAVGASSWGRGTDGDARAVAATAASRPTAAVERRDLVEREELDGTLGYGDAMDLSLQRPGTITGLPSEGSVLERNGVAAEVDGAAVRVLFGARPLWRALGPGVSNGADVRQLEENLVAMGHATASNLAVDDTWTEATTAAVKRWQKANGVEQSGTVAPGDVAVVPGPARVVSRKASIGGPAAGPVLSFTATTKIVTIELEASRRDLVTVGMEVDVELPDGTTTKGSVASIASVVTPPADDPQGGGSPTIDVTVALVDPGSVAFDEAPVDVRIVSTKAEDALTVPVEALLAQAGGTYAVERVAGDGVQVVPVEPGAFADGYVEVRGELSEGDRVVVPR